MKKILILTLVIACGVAFSDGWAKRPKKNQPAQELISAERDSALQALKDEMKRDEDNFRAQLEALKEEIQSAQEEMKTDFPCAKEAVSDEEYFAAFGVSKAMPNQRYALQDAIRNAQQKIVDLMNNGNAVIDIVIDNVEMTCQKFAFDSQGKCVAYVAVRVPKKQ